ncbi:major facilitator family transporter [Legionella beliardensis]|uniref:Major facilitator family transporter n=2 Tax=Legionella beliardensis TaxID=91822 RepID=A0A378HZQ7_9GAMM|nr:major facilitator family transporter [Legionella beliardensis]
MLIPVFTVFATGLHHATPTLIGIALGSYGLSQGLLQMPFGMLSDYYGRKRVIATGLILFAIGSLVGALTDSIYGMIVARILQGMGAIGSVLIALVADLTADEERTKAMAVIGMTIGISFSVAMVLSPAVAHYYGLAGIFYLTAALALAGLVMLYGVIPNPEQQRFHTDSEANVSLLKTTITNRHLLRLNLGIFLQHFILTATFFALPLLLQQQLNVGHLTHQWHFYLPLMVLSFILMVPLIYFAEKKRLIKPIFLLAVFLTLSAQFFLAFTYNHFLSLCLLMLLYFTAFNILEASLPSLISKQASANSKGTAMGVYSSCQFLGIFIGGFMAGILYQYLTVKAIFITNALLGLAWLIIALPMNAYLYQVTVILTKPKINQAKEIELIKILQTLSGVINVSVLEKENTIYLKVDKASYVPGSAEKNLQQFLEFSSDNLQLSY